jgi:hypothetical protein
MPYVPGPKVHGVIHVADVYKSSNVYVNSVPVALWLTPGSSAGFAGVNVEDVSPLVDTNIVTITANNTNQLITEQQSNPSGPNSFYNGNAAVDGVKGNYSPAEDGVDITNIANTGTISTSTSSASLVAFLQNVVSEASRGMWRETGQGGKPSNPNITGIWSNLGFGTASPWNTDQTAWCMGFVNYALKASGYKYVKTASAAAITQNPAAWGAVQVPKDQAQPGDIAFWNYRHVNFVYTANAGKYTFVGGNQSPKASNNPNDGDVTQSYPNGAPASLPTWVSCYRPTKT